MSMVLAVLVLHSVFLTWEMSMIHQGSTSGAWKMSVSGTQRPESQHPAEDQDDCEPSPFPDPRALF